MGAEFLGEKPEYCLAVEDAEAGIDARITDNLSERGLRGIKSHMKRYQGYVKVSRTQ